MAMPEDRMAAEAKTPPREAHHGRFARHPNWYSDKGHQGVEHFSSPRLPVITPRLARGPEPAAAGVRSMQREGALLPAKPKIQAAEQPAANDLLINEFAQFLKRLAAGKSIDEVATMKQLNVVGAPHANDVMILTQALNQRTKMARRVAAACQQGDDEQTGGKHEFSTAQSEILQDRQQLEAQISFMEKKIEKLRLKLFRPPEEPPTLETMSKEEASMTRDEFVNLTLALRAEVAAAEERVCSVQNWKNDPDMLKANIQKAQMRADYLRAEKEADETEEALARRFVAEVEVKLQEVVKMREAEQSGLLEARRVIEEKLESQSKELIELEKQRAKIIEGQTLRAELARKEFELETCRKEADLREQRWRDNVKEKSECRLAVACVASVVNKATEDATKHLIMVLASKEGDTEEIQKLQKEVQKNSNARIRVAKKSATEAEERLARQKQEFEVISEMSHRRIQQKREELQKVEGDSQARLRRLQLDHENDFALLMQQQVEVQEPVDDCIERRIDDEAAIDKIKSECEAMRAAHEEHLRKMRVEFQAEETQLKSRIEKVKGELQVAMEDVELARQEREYRGCLWIVVRRGQCDEETLVGSVCEAVPVPRHRIRVLETDAEECAAPPTHLAGIADRGDCETQQCDQNVQRADVAPPKDAPPLRTRNGAMLRAGRGKPTAPEANDPANGNKDTAGTKKAEFQFVSAPKKLDPSERCFQIEFLQPTAAPGAQVIAQEQVLRILSCIKEGNKNLDPLGIIRATIARGEAEPADTKSQGTFPVAERHMLNVHGWSLVVTAYLQQDPFVLRFVAFDGDSGREFSLHLSAEDVEAIVPGVTRSQMAGVVASLSPHLRIITRDGRFHLAAMQECIAPASFSNGVDDLVRDKIQLSAEWRRKQRELKPEQDTAKSHLATIPCSEKIEVNAWIRVQEEVLIFQGSFVNLAIDHETQTGTIRLDLVEASSCLPFQIVLPGHPNGANIRQERLHSQFCALQNGPSLLLAVEEVIAPPLLIVRVGEYPEGPISAETKRVDTFCTSTLDWKPAPLPPLREQRHLMHLLDMPPAVRAATEGFAALRWASSGTETWIDEKPTPGGKMLKRQALQYGLTCVLECCEGDGRLDGHGYVWTLVQQAGRRLTRGTISHLYVIQVYVRMDPFERYLVLSYEIDSCREWELHVAGSSLRAVPSSNTDAVDSAAKLIKMVKFGVSPCASTTAEEDVLMLEGAGSTSAHVRLQHTTEANPEDDSPTSCPLATACLEHVLNQTAAIARHSGGVRIDLSKTGAQADSHCRRLLHHCAHRFGTLDLLLTLEERPASMGGHVLSVYHPASCELVEVHLAAGRCECPEKFCVQRFRIADYPLVVALTETAFPHAIHALVRDPAAAEKGNRASEKDEKQTRFSVADNDIYRVLPKAERHVFRNSAEELLESGVVRVQVSAGTIVKPSPGSADVGVLPDSAVPTVLMNMLGPAQLVCRAKFTVRTEKFHICIAKAANCGGFSLAIAPEFSSISLAHVIHVSRAAEHSGCDEALGATGEIRRFGEVDLMIYTVFDVAPRALRLVVVAAATGEPCLHLMVLDNDGSSGSILDPRIKPSPLAARLHLLHGLRASPFCAEPADPASGVFDAPPPESCEQGDTSWCICETTRILASGMPMLLSVFRENTSDGSGLRLRVVGFDPAAARESSLVVAGADLKKVLAACGLNMGHENTDREVDAARADIVACLLPAVHVHPDGSGLEFVEKLVSPPPCGSA